MKRKVILNYSHIHGQAHTWAHPGWSLWLVFLFSRYASQVWIRSQGKSSLTKSAVSPVSGNLVKERFQNGFHISRHQVRYASIGWNTHCGGDTQQGASPPREEPYSGRATSPNLLKTTSCVLAVLLERTRVQCQHPYTRQLTIIYTQGTQHPLLVSKGTRHLCSAQTHMQTKHSHTK